jgi:hypothetical protein
MVGNAKGNNPPEKPKCRWEDNTEVDITIIEI